MKVKLALIFIASIVQLFFNKVKMITCSQILPDLMKNKEIGPFLLKRCHRFALLLIGEHLLTESSFHILLLAPCPMIDGYVPYVLIFLEMLLKLHVVITYFVKNALDILLNVLYVTCLLLVD